MREIDVVMQGPLCSQTYNYALSYLEIPQVNKVIISTWEKQTALPPHDRITVLYSPGLENPGQNNRNRQIFSTQKGIELCEASVIIKTRTDEHIRPTAWARMWQYFLDHNAIDEKFVDGSGPKGAIFCVVLYTRFVFHPEDHLFMGWAEDMRALFDLPLDPIFPVNMENPGDNVGIYSDWAHTDTRPNAYIGMYYYARFNERIRYMVEHYKEFVVDDAPQREEALKLDQQYRNKIFKAFPQVDIWWSKHGRGYPYDWCAAFTGYSA